MVRDAADVLVGVSLVTRSPLRAAVECMPRALRMGRRAEAARRLEADRGSRLDSSFGA